MKRKEEVECWMKGGETHVKLDTAAEEQPMREKKREGGEGGGEGYSTNKQICKRETSAIDVTRQHIGFPSSYRLS